MEFYATFFKIWTLVYCSLSFILSSLQNDPRKKFLDIVSFFFQYHFVFPTLAGLIDTVETKKVRKIAVEVKNIF